MIPRSHTDALSAVVFDWDGTLMDSIGRIVRCLHLAITEVGAEPRSDLQLRDIIGLGVREATLALFPDADEAFVEDLTRAYRWFFLHQDDTPTPLFPDALPVLETLAERGFVLAVATGKSRRGLDEAMHATGLHGVFQATATADEHPSKPNPAMLQYVLDRVGVVPEDALMVGDSTHDLAMAAHLGVLAVGVTQGAHSSQVLREYPHAALISRLEELPHLLNLRQD